MLAGFQRAKTRDESFDCFITGVTIGTTSMHSSFPVTPNRDRDARLGGESRCDCPSKGNIGWFKSRRRWLRGKRTARPGCGTRILCMVGTVAVGCWAGFQLDRQPDAAASRKAETGLPGIPSLSGCLAELVTYPPEALPAFDVALVNLLCAEGLPGAEGMDAHGLLVSLDAWARRIEAETQRHLYRFRGSPGEYDNSEGYFRMLMMAVVVAEDCRVRYNPARISPVSQGAGNDGFFADAQDVFLHGLLGPRRLGTCSSMPILYVALGRRMGYPLKLVTTKGHLFLRWESTTERFNLEATGRGMNRYDDAHYRQWPFPLTDQEVADNGYLQSLTPVQELAVFLAIRGACWQANGRLREAHEAFAEAARLVPRCLLYKQLAAGLAPAQVPATVVAGAAVPLPTQPAFPAFSRPAHFPHLEPNPLRQLNEPNY
jgi:hypothetical protein